MMYNICVVSIDICLYLKRYAKLVGLPYYHIYVYMYVLQIYVIQGIDLCYCAFNLYAFMQLIYLMHRIK